MNIKTATFNKEIKIGLPNYSNVTVGFGMTVELKEGEELNISSYWDKVNAELALQTEGLDPDWIKTGEYNRFFKIEVKIPKQ